MKGLLGVAVAVLVGLGVAPVSAAAGCPVTQLGVAESYGIDALPTAMSGDGRTVAFSEDDDGALVVREVGGGVVRTFEPMESGDMITPSLSRDGGTVAFVELDYACGRGGCAPLASAYVADVATGARIELTPGRHSWQPALADDAGSVVYATSPDGYFGADRIVRRDLRTGAETTVATGLDDVQQPWQAMDTDGRKVVFSGRFDHRDYFQVYVFRPATGALTQVSRTGGADPQFLAGGRRVSFWSDRGGTDPERRRRTLMHDLATGRATAVLPTAIDARVSANGNRIAFASRANLNGGNRERNIELYSYNGATGATQQLTSTSSGAPQLAAVSDNGSTVLFVSAVDPDGALYLATVSTRCRR